MKEAVEILRLVDPLAGWLVPKMEEVSDKLPRVDAEFKKVFGRPPSNSLRGHGFRDVIGHDLHDAMKREDIPGLENASYDKPPVTAVHVTIDGVKFRFLREGGRFSKRPIQFVLPETTPQFDEMRSTLASDYLIIHTFGETPPTLSIAKPVFQGEIMTRSVRLEWRFQLPMDRFQGNPRPFEKVDDDELENLIRPTYETYIEISQDLDED